jgi:hypothetical protein
MSKLPPDRPEVLDAEAAADALFGMSQEIADRPASVKADSWHKVRSHVLGEQAPRGSHPRLAQWTLAALIGGTLALGAILASLGTQPLGAFRHRAASPATPVATAASAPPTPINDGWREVDLGPTGRLFVAPGAAFRLPAPQPSEDEDYVVFLDGGEICAEVAHRDPATQGPFLVQAPGLRAVAVGTRFCVFAAAAPDSSWVMVEEGQVRVERINAGHALVGAGGVIHAGDRELLATVETSRANRPARNRVKSECPPAPLSAKEECLWRQTGGEDLAAQNALYLLGSIARDEEHDGRSALSIWQTYLHRFPEGVLAAETMWAIFNQLVAEHRLEDALSASDDFLATFPRFFRAGEIELKRGDLLREELLKPREAAESYEHVLAHESRPLLRDDALFGLGLCQEKLGQASSARASWTLYLRQFPQGLHRAEVVQRVGSTKATPTDGER